MVPHHARRMQPRHRAPTPAAPGDDRRGYNRRMTVTPQQRRIGRRVKRRINHLPRGDDGNGWSQILPPRTPAPPLAARIQADWLVIGAGYAGLAAARRLAAHRPGDDIVLLDAHVVGENASGRNSGFAIDLPHVVGGAQDDLSSARRYMALARAAIADLETQITRHNIACDWSRAGKYQTAVSARGEREVLEPFARELAALDEAFEWVAQDDLARRLGTAHFKSAVYTPGCRLFNPAALTHGLASALPSNVKLFEASPVTAIDAGAAVEVHTPAGAVTAARLILCVNAFAPQFGYYRRRLLPFAANASLSRRLTSDERARLACEDNWGVTPANAFASVTMRFTRDHRILMRQGLYYNPRMRESGAQLAAATARHKRMFDERFPMLKEVDMEYTWTGYICLSQNSAPGFGKLAHNIYAAVCQNAVGVTKGTMSGLLAADWACGVDNELIGQMQTLGAPSRLPPQPLLGWGVRAKMAWELWRARGEV